MPYNPDKHHRRSIRLKGYDYSRAGLYFITICCQDRICRFGHVDNGEMVLNEFGQIAYNEWCNLPKRFANFELDVFQIMPNHMHGIIVLNNAVGAGFTPAQNGNNPENDTPAQNVAVAQNETDIIQWAGASPAPTTNASISDIVGAYKSLVANGCLDIYKSNNKTMGKLWQRDYYEHIIRNEQSYQTITNYIIDNPAKWNEDKFYTAQ
ncbi:MAG TPA: transposase [Paludibacter sp.]